MNAPALRSRGTPAEMRSGELHAKNPSTDPRIARTDAALQAAVLEMLDEMTMEQIAVRDICRRAEVHYSTFYRRYGTKKVLIDRIAADQIDTVIRLTVPIMDNVDTESGFLALFSYVKAYRKLWHSLLTGGASAMMRASMLASAKLLSPGRAPKPAIVPNELARICAVNTIIDCITWWLGQSETDWPVPAMARIADTLVQSSVPRRISSER